MNESDKKKILQLYGCDEPITSYIIHSGTKIGGTNKSKLKIGSVKNLEDKQ